MTRIQLVIAAALVLASSSVVHAQRKGETKKVMFYYPASKLYLNPNGYHVNKPASRVSVTTVGRDVHETWIITYTGEKTKRGVPVCTIESTNRACGAYKFMSVTGDVKNTKDSAVIGKMEVSLSNKPMKWYVEKTSKGTTINLAHAGGYVVSVKGAKKNCVLGWDNDTSDQVVQIKAAK